MLDQVLRQARRNHTQPVPKSRIKIHVSCELNERIAMDICGLFMNSKRGDTVVLAITDHFSKYTETFELPDQKATTIAKILVNKLFHVQCEPQEIHCDQETNFNSELIKQVYELYGITKTRTTPYHPQGDGQVERFNKTMMNIVYLL